MEQIAVRSKSMRKKTNLICRFNQKSGKYIKDTATSKKFGHVILNGIHFFGSKP